MNVREKLVELLKNAKAAMKSENLSCDIARNMFVVDFMMANGVTVQEWISVDDRLPEDDSDVLAYSRNGEECRIYPANYAKGVWFDCIFTTPVTDTTTHWMPLPSTEGLE